MNLTCPTSDTHRQMSLHSEQTAGLEHGPTCRPVFTCRTVIEEKQGCLVIDCYLVALLCDSLVPAVKCVNHFCSYLCVPTDCKRASVTHKWRFPEQLPDFSSSRHKWNNAAVIMLGYCDVHPRANC